jgi:hypothetical protein
MNLIIKRWFLLQDLTSFLWEMRRDGVPRNTAIKKPTEAMSQLELGAQVEPVAVHLSPCIIMCVTCGWSTYGQSGLCVLPQAPTAILVLHNMRCGCRKLKALAGTGVSAEGESLTLYLKP